MASQPDIPPTPVRRKEYRALQLDRLTSLRFFAAILVVVHHATLGPTPLPGLASVAKLGYVGVTFFFILSGFVLAWSGRPDLPARHFYGRRFARIYPTHFITMFIAIALFAIIGLKLRAGSIITTVTLTHSWIPNRIYSEDLNNVSWSLADEAFFYALFPFLFRSWFRLNKSQLYKRILISAVCMTFLTIVLRAAFPASIAGNILYKFPPFRFGEFAIGVALGLLVRSGWRSPLGTAQASMIAIASYLTIAIGLALLGRSGLIRVIPDMLMIAPFGLLIASAASADVSAVKHGRGLASNRIVLLGRASFQLYMTHFLLLLVMAEMFPDVETLAQIPYLVVYVLLAVGLSVASYKSFEIPVERYLRARLGQADVARKTTLR